MSLAKQILNGDVRAASKLMRDLEDRIPSALEVLKEIYPKTGRAYLIGITGAPGTGKSTLVDKMVDVFRKGGKRIGIIAVDPTSPFTGGALLGDRIRMQRHASDEAVFIRSLATRGSLGGLSRATNDILTVMDAMGKEIILIETVGVGQDEVDIVNTAHTSIVVLVPGMGDDIQALKAGIIEIGDLFVINKCDRQGAESAERDLRMALELSGKRKGVWHPEILKTEALHGKGIVELVSAIDRHKRMLEQSGGMVTRRRERAKALLLDILKHEIMAHVAERMDREERWDPVLEDVVQRKTDPYSTVNQLMTELLITPPRGADSNERDR